MTKTRRSFTDEFKQEAVALLESSGRPVGQIATELGIQPSMLRNWRRREATSGGAAQGQRMKEELPATRTVNLCQELFALP